MIIYPAVDILDRHVVRLEQGQADRKTVYSNNPVAFAQQWESQGASWLHVVDLNGAFEGRPTNLDLIGEIAATLKIPVQMGGGLRDEAVIAEAFRLGIRRVVLGTKACASLEFVRRLADTYGSERIAVGIDARDGRVATKGWTEASEWDAIQLATAATVSGAGTIIYTDIATDGMFSGPNYPALRELLAAVDVPVIASGGVASKAHIEALRALPQLHGAIVGKALYDGKVKLSEII